MRRPLVLLAAAGLAVLGGGHLIMLAATRGVPRGDELPALRAGEQRAAVVFGAGLNRDGGPSAVLRDRIRAGVRLLEAGKVDLLIMSGDNRVHGYSEPTAMRRAAIDLGVPPAQIALDYAGRRTWDSCVRARTIFGLRRAVVVSSDFHRARTILLCREAGLQVVGATGTSSRPYPARWKWRGRELLASWLGLYDAWIKHPGSVVGGPRIDPYDPCSLWRSLSPDDQQATPTLGRGC